ncbi:hypothetical protein L6452_12518 [Arctium lappa]|uniref:Uncharacterized protein n=1 Tax=Arctium lappa TaxID=4217 RepID=A0ACB9DRC1_ARCLA|nr:hypothetical protein L6452_12518 [Arctium lappa]
MGKQWLLYKFTSDGGAGGCHGTGKSSSTTKTTKAARKYSRKTADHIPTPSSSSPSSSSSTGGCMSAIFHLFDIQHHHFPFHQPSFISDSSFVNIPHQSNIILQGVEAPRNSLELDEELVASSSSSSSSKPKQEINLNIPMGGIQIKTKRSRLMMDDVSSECSSSTSPGTKTPNLVARLMGLDLLPENSSPRPSLSSPRPSSSSSHATPLNPLSKLSSNSNKHQTATRSLPVTPRMSTAADYHHHRLSLEIKKENSSEYAKQIAKQVRENISRRVGVDITNTMKNKEERRDQCLVVLKPKRRSSSISPPSKENEPLSCSPRLRLLEIKNNLKKPISNPPSSSSNMKSSSPPLVMKDVEKVKLHQDDEITTMKVQKYKKLASEKKYDLRLKKKHQQEEPFVKKKSCNKKSTPLSNRLLNVNTTTKFISFKKDMASSPSSTPTTTILLPQKQVPLETHKLSIQDNYSNHNGVATAVTGGSVHAASDDYFDYISRILRHTGIEKTTPISIANWYSPSHPLHPSIFHHLEELLHPTAAGDLPNRKLIFAAVDEVLVEILKPYITFKPWAAGRRYSRRMYGWELVEMICRKIKSFPAADCRVLEDIDGLIAGDLRGSTGAVAFEEEAEEVVKEMEREMVEMLVDEMAMMLGRSDGGHVHGGFT